MISGAMDAENVKVAQPVVAVAQKKAYNKHEFGALKGWADTDEILDQAGEVQNDALLGNPTHQHLLESYMQPSNQERLEELMMLNEDTEKEVPHDYGDEGAISAQHKYTMD